MLICFLKSIRKIFPASFQAGKSMSHLGCLYEITNAVTSSTTVRSSVSLVTSILAANTNLTGGNAVFLDTATGLLENSADMPTDSLKAGIVRRVLSGEVPLIVPLEEGSEETGENPRYFICVPIKASKKTIGAIYAERQYYNGMDLEEDLQLLTVLSGVFMGVAKAYGFSGEQRLVNTDGTGHLSGGSNITFAEQVEMFEKEIIVKALEKARGNQTRAASDLGTSLRIFNYKVGKYLIDYREFRKTGK